MFSHEEVASWGRGAGQQGPEHSMFIFLQLARSSALGVSISITGFYRNILLSWEKGVVGNFM